MTSSCRLATMTTIRRPGLAPGLQGAKLAFQFTLNAFSDFRHTIEDQIAEGDRVVTSIRAYGTHTGEFLGIAPTGKEVSMRGIAIHRIANGKLVEHWGRVDNVGLLIQLGAITVPAQPLVRRSVGVLPA